MEREGGLSLINEISKYNSGSKNLHSFTVSKMCKTFLGMKRHTKFPNGFDFFYFRECGLVELPSSYYIYIGTPSLR